MRRGFTLVELLIVIIILAVIAAVAIPKLSDSTRRAKEAALKDRLGVLRTSIERFHNDTGLYPSALNVLKRRNAGSTGLNAGGNSVSIPAGSAQGPYVDQIPKDPISGNSFSYSTTRPTVGEVKANSRGNFLDGTPYTDF